MKISKILVVFFIAVYFLSCNNVKEESPLLKTYPLTVEEKKRIDVIIDSHKMLLKTDKVTFGVYESQVRVANTDTITERMIIVVQVKTFNKDVLKRPKELNSLCKQLALTLKKCLKDSLNYQGLALQIYVADDAMIMKKESGLRVGINFNDIK